MTEKKKTGLGGKGGSGRRTTRDKAQRVKTAKGRKSSSTQWLQRQLNDPYAREAQRLGYKSRAAFKLKEINEKANIIKRGMVVLDLGSAPGGWSQVSVELGAKTVVAIDLLPMDAIAGVTFFQMDFMADEAPQTLMDALGEKADVVLSDMSPNTTGHKSTDHIRIMGLAEAGAYFAVEVLKPGGAFIAKVFQGGAQKELLDMLKANFDTVKHVKPPASRKDSAEQYVIATKFKG